MSAIRWKVTSQTNGWCIHTDDKDKLHITDVDNQETAAQIVSDHNAHDALCRAIEMLLDRTANPITDHCLYTLEDARNEGHAALRQAGR